MKFKIELPMGSVTPPLYGVAWFDPYKRVAICFPIPINWIIAGARNLYWALLIPPDIKEKTLSNRYNEGWSTGYSEGYKRGRLMGIAMASEKEKHD